jgi:transcriptional regulator GlxA family with amidase domain
MNARLVYSGVLLGLSDPRLSKAIEVMHKHPETSWSLEQLAQHAGMSRARFATHFRKVVGITPFDYLTNCASASLRPCCAKGNSLKLIATAVGYTNATALTRVLHPAPGHLTHGVAPRSTGTAPSIAAELLRR